MIYKHARLEKKLREHGRSAPAEILSMRSEGSGNSVKGTFAPDDDLTKSWTSARLELRVMPEGEPPFEVTVRTRLNTFKYKGDTVPVLYDPNDHDKVVVDYETDAREAMEGLARRQAAGAGGRPDSFGEEAAAFAERAAEFRDRTAGLQRTNDLLAAILKAKAAGDRAEVERLKAEFQQSAAVHPSSNDQIVAGGPLPHLGPARASGEAGGPSRARRPDRRRVCSREGEDPEPEALRRRRPRVRPLA